MANQSTNQPPGGTLTPTFQGFIGSTMDALILFEACLSGPLAHVSRRPHDRERPQLIQSGNVFIYEEHSSGIKRWTDGVPWSPSRILGNFLLYRELDKPFQPGEKKRAMKRNKEGGVSKSTTNLRANSISTYGSGVLSATTTMSAMENTTPGNDAERPYIGSLIDSYQFKENGLVKKTISVQHKGVSHHLVSYYNLEDIRSKKLRAVSETPELANIVPRGSLMSSANFRAPVDDNELAVDPARAYALGSNVGFVGIDGLPSRSLSIPQNPFGHAQAWGGAQHYGHNQSYMQQAIQPPATSYPQQLVPTSTYAYPHDTTFGLPRPPSYNTMVQTPRRHSVMPSTNGSAQLGYQSALLANGGGLVSHSISHNPYGGDVFNASAAAAAAETSPAGSTGGYSTAGTISQTNGTHSMGNSVTHSTTGFDSQLPNGYEGAMNRLQIHEYGDTLQDSTGPNFAPTSTSTTPTHLSMGVDHSELSSAEQEWNRTGPIIPKREGDQW
ncbi:Gti1/Pac2 family-domain-containing protein [Xylaria digitata]|nr:Gti1/Pac2 family-domain-containing protein [Xylaria digitata]